MDNRSPEALEANHHQSCSPGYLRNERTEDTQEKLHTGAISVHRSRNAQDAQKHHSRRTDVILAWKNIFSRSGPNRRSKAKSQHASTHGVMTTSKTHSNLTSGGIGERLDTDASDAAGVAATVASSSTRLGVGPPHLRWAVRLTDWGRWLSWAGSLMKTTCPRH